MLLFVCAGISTRKCSQELSHLLGIVGFTAVAIACGIYLFKYCCNCSCFFHFSLNASVELGREQRIFDVCKHVYKVKCTRNWPIFLTFMEIHSIEMSCNFFKNRVLCSLKYQRLVVESNVKSNYKKNVDKSFPNFFFCEKRWMFWF